MENSQSTLPLTILRGEQQLGQFSEEEVREGLSSGRFLSTDLWWKAGMENWEPITVFSAPPADETVQSNVAPIPAVSPKNMEVKKSKFMRRALVFVPLFLVVCIALAMHIRNALRDSAHLRSSKQSAASVALKSGIAKFKEDEDDEAIAAFNKALEIDPKYADAYVHRGQYYIEKGEYGKAVADLSKGLKLGSKNTDARNDFEVAKKLVAERGQRASPAELAADYDKAIANYTKKLERSGKIDTWDFQSGAKTGETFIDESAYHERGKVYVRKGDYDRAIADFENALFVIDFLAQQKSLEKHSFHYLQRKHSVESSLAKAEKLAGKGTGTAATRGSGGEKEFDADRFMADITKTIELNPKVAGNYESRGYQYAKKGDYDRAIADYTKAIELEPNPIYKVGAYFERGEAYLKKGSHYQAVADLTKAIELSPSHITAYNARAKAHLERGEYDRAIADSTKAIEFLECDPTALGMFSMQTKAEARDTLEKAKKARR